MKIQRAAWSVLGSATLAAVGCGSEVTEPPPEPAPAVKVVTYRPEPSAPKGPLETIGVWRGSFDGRELTFTPLDAAAKSSGLSVRNFQDVPTDALGITTVGSVVVNNGTGNPAKTRCVTNHNGTNYFGISSDPVAVPGGGPDCEDQHLCANVEVQNNTGRTVDNLYFEVTDISPVVTPAFRGDNSVTAPSDFGLVATGGLWNFESLTDGQTSAATRLNFFLPNCNNFTFNVTVKGTARPTAYNVFGSPPPADLPPDMIVPSPMASGEFINACNLAGNTRVFGPVQAGVPDVLDISGDVAIGFPFSLYGTTFNATQPVRISADGRVGLQLVAWYNAELPTTDNSYAFFPFWTAAAPRNSGVCYARTGSVGSRKFVVTWVNADFDPGDVGSNQENLTYSLVLEEGTDAFEFQYKQWTLSQTCLDPGGIPNTSELSRGGSATIGVQGSSSTAIQLSYNLTFLPPVIATCPVNGVKYRFEPNPTSTF